jgi:RNA ligase (TIGR02306 family)
MRKLASLRTISDIRPIEGADAIECAVVDGWTVVVKKGEFKPGDFVVFFEIDSWIPTTIAPFLTPRGQKPHVYNGIEGERLRTVKLRGQLSQGLVMPITAFPEVVEYMKEVGPECSNPLDLTEILKIQKWEPPIPAQLSGQVKGAFPSRIRKTDQERIQNLLGVVFDGGENENAEYEVTIKLDGSSMTVYYLDGEVGVCSRNLNLKLDQEGNTFVDTSKKIGILEKLASLGRNIAIQGELMGEGIQGNRETLKGHHFFVFDIWDIDNAKYLSPDERYEFCEKFGLLHVPVIHSKITFKDLGLTNLEEMLKFADGPSMKNPIREGVVFKRVDGKFSFKVISNLFLLKGGV